MHIAVDLIHGKPECRTCIDSGPLAVVSHGKSQGSGCLGPFHDSCIFNQACLRYFGVTDLRLYITLQIVHAYRSAQCSFMGRIVRRHARAAGEPVQRRSARPGSGKKIVGGFVFQFSAGAVRSQGQFCIVQHRRRCTVIPVHAHTAGQSGVKAVIRCIVILGDWLIAAEIPALLGLAVAKELVCLGYRPADYVLERIGNIAFCL